jgi:hypothetical protein
MLGELMRPPGVRCRLDGPALREKGAGETQLNVGLSALIARRGRLMEQSTIASLRALCLPWEQERRLRHAERAPTSCTSAACGCAI